ncbi:MAG: FGGY family carbohydrate kinase, partial [Clostridia bacterium]|nr:FGGY family carbohydrate kinase [Clostridia bacterium]
MNGIIIAADIGTTNVKCVVADLNLKVLSMSASEYPTRNTGYNCFEHDPLDWYKHFKIAMTDAVARSGMTTRDVKCVAMSAQAPTFLPVDGEGNPLHNALIWMDRRADRQCERMRELVGNDMVYSLTGNIIDPYYVMPKILWFKDNYPDLYAKTKAFLQVNGYVNYRLTGIMSIDDVHACLTLGYDARKNCWAREILDPLDVDPALFPEVYRVGDVIGGVSEKASGETGLPVGTPVLAGCPDAAAASVEAGVAPDGASAEMSGTSSVLMTVSDKVLTSEKLTYMRAAHGGWHTLLGCMSSTGASLKWFRDTLYPSPDSPDAYDRMNDEIAKTCPEPTKLLFLPYMAGERSPLWDSGAKGAIYGLTLGTSRSEIIRAIFEGSALALYDNYLAIVEAGGDIGVLRAVGGAANSPMWLKIKASVLDRPIEVPKTNLGAPGGMIAIIAHYLGLSPSIEKAAEGLLDIDRVIEPV